MSDEHAISVANPTKRRMQLLLDLTGYMDEREKVIVELLKRIDDVEQLALALAERLERKTPRG